MDEYKPNSHKSKEEEKERSEKKVEKVISGKARSKKKSELSKFTDALISEDAANVKSYIFMDVLMPAIKKAISDIVTNGIDMILYGETGHSKKSSASKVSYRNYYDRDRDSRESRSSRRRYDYNEVVLESRRDAEEVLAGMDDLIDRYKFVSVADFYDLVGEESVYTDNKYGWTDIRSAEPIRVRNGYVLKLPRPLPLD